MNGPPEKLPPKFRVGQKVYVRAHGRPVLGTITNVREQSEEWLIRTAYAAGYYAYTVEADVFNSAMDVSENLLTPALIESLADLVENDE